MERRIQTFITRNKDAKTYKALSTGTLPRQDAIAKHDKTPTHSTRCQDLQDAFNRHAPSTRRDRKTRQDAFTLDKTPRPARRFQQARSLDKTRSESTTIHLHTRQDAYTLDKTPRPARRFQQARSLDKTRSQNTTRRLHTRQDAKTCKTLSTGTLPRQDAIAKHDKTPTHSTRREDLQDAFNRHAPSTRRDRKTRQDAYTLDKTRRPARRFQQARSLDKTRSESMTRRLHTRQDAKTCKTLLTGTLPRQDAIGKHDKTHTNATRSQDVQDAFDGHAPFTRRDRKTRQDAKTCKTLSTGTLPHQDAIAKHDKTYSCITRPQDLQDAFDRHAPISRRVHKNKTRRICVCE